MAAAAAAVSLSSPHRLRSAPLGQGEASLFLHGAGACRPDHTTAGLRSRRRCWDRIADARRASSARARCRDGRRASDDPQRRRALRPHRCRVLDHRLARPGQHAHRRHGDIDLDSRERRLRPHVRCPSDRRRVQRHAVRVPRRKGSASSHAPRRRDTAARSSRRRSTSTPAAAPAGTSSPTARTARAPPGRRRSASVRCRPATSNAATAPRCGRSSSIRAERTTPRAASSRSSSTPSAAGR